MRVPQLRRLRRNQAIRDWLSQTHLKAEDFILPYFIVGGRKLRQPIKSLPGIARLSIDNLLADIEAAGGIKAVLLFGIPDAKDCRGAQAYKGKGVVQRAVGAVKKRFPGLIVITDVCLCGYTTDGHCGLIKGGLVDNEATVKILARVALSHARAGADFVAPSAMMDGQVRAIRENLDRAGFNHTGIFSYSAKYASGFYGPFREAVGSAPTLQFGDRRAEQMDYRNSDEALREIGQDIDEGADIAMVKPALAYLDIIYRAKQKFNIPVAAYNVSAEYALVKKLAENDSTKEKELALEVLTAIKRAGADLVITYFAKEAIRWIK